MGRIIANNAESSGVWRGFEQGNAEPLISRIARMLGRGREARGGDGKLGGGAEFSWCGFGFWRNGHEGRGGLGQEAGGSDGRSGGRKFRVNRFSIQGRVFACWVECIIKIFLGF